MRTAGRTPGAGSAPPLCAPLATDAWESQGLQGIGSSALAAPAHPSLHLHAASMRPACAYLPPEPCFLSARRETINTCTLTVMHGCPSLTGAIERLQSIPKVTERTCCAPTAHPPVRPHHLLQVPAHLQASRCRHPWLLLPLLPTYWYQHLPCLRRCPGRLPRQEDRRCQLAPEVEASHFKGLGVTPFCNYNTTRLG
jgi:hypothetical protein